MTGIDCLKEELLRRGCTKQQLSSKLIPIILDIVSNSGGQYTAVYDAERDLAELRCARKNAALDAERYRAEAAALEKEADQIREQIREAILDFENQIDGLEARIANGSETAEGRDALRKAQMFVNAVSVETKYDNTAYIIGLASILSGGECGAIDTLAKINPKIPPRVKALRSWARDGWRQI